MTHKLFQRAKKKYGIHSSDDSEILEGKIASAHLVALLRPNLEKLATEIDRSFAFYREKERGAPVELLLLLGRGSNLKNLTQNLSEAGCEIIFWQVIGAFVNTHSQVATEPLSSLRGL